MLGKNFNPADVSFHDAQALAGFVKAGGILVATVEDGPQFSLSYQAGFFCIVSEKTGIEVFDEFIDAFNILCKRDCTCPTCEGAGFSRAFEVCPTCLEFGKVDGKVVAELAVAAFEAAEV